MRQVSKIIGDMIATRIEIREFFHIELHAKNGLSEIETRERERLNSKFRNLQIELEEKLGAMIYHSSENR